MDTITPTSISNPIRKLAKQLVPQPAFHRISIHPETGSIVNECFENVKLKIERDGGSIQHGWQIVELPNIFIEAVFHAVWVSPNGEFVDITPPEPPCDEILFIPDLARVYMDKGINNERRPLRNDKAIRDFLRISQEIAQLQIDGEVPGDPTQTVVNPRKLYELNERKAELLEFLKSGGTEASLCFCGSKKIYKVCHALK